MRKLRLLIIGAGATYSTADVEDGLIWGLERAGHEVIRYRLDRRLTVAGAWLHHQWRTGGKRGPRPNGADTIYYASYEALLRALRFEVDGVFVVSGMYFHPDQLILMRRAGMRTAILLTESPYDDGQQAKVLQYVDVAFTNERTSVGRLREYNPRTHYVGHAYHPEKHQSGERGEAVAQHDVVFVGTGFQERIDLLSKVNWDGIDLGLYGHWSLLGSRHPLRRFIRGSVVDNTTTAALYRRARIGLNLHRTSMGFGRHAPRIAYAESLNPRAYELAATGCFYLSDRRREGAELFGTAVPTFGDAAELETLIRWWLNQEEMRARRGYLLTTMVKPHHWGERAREIVALLEEGWFGSRPAAGLLAVGAGAG